jgi:hypothetical protein
MQKDFKTFWSSLCRISRGANGIILGLSKNLKNLKNLKNPKHNCGAHKALTQKLRGHRLNPKAM